jgi:hypothetical protein
MTFTLFSTFFLHLDKVVNNKLMIKADDDTYFSIDVTADMLQGETIQVVTGYQAPTVNFIIHYYGEAINPAMKWKFGSILTDKILEKLGNYVETKTIEIVAVKFMKDSETLIFSGVTKAIERGV